MPIAEYRKDHIVEIDYTNWKGERRRRKILPDSLVWGNTPHHPEKQWLLEAWDIEDDTYKDFALKDIHSWSPCVVEPLYDIVFAQEVMGGGFLVTLDCGHKMATKEKRVSYPCRECKETK